MFTCKTIWTTKHYKWINSKSRQPVTPSKYADLIYGTIVVTFGEYGLCPTVGRIVEQHRTNILNILHNELADYAYRTRGWYEDDERSNH